MLVFTYGFSKQIVYLNKNVRLHYILTIRINILPFAYNRLLLSHFCRSYITVLLMWMKMFPEDFQRTPDYSHLKRLISLADDYTGGSDVRVAAEKLLRRFEATGFKTSLVDGELTLV